MPQPKKQGPTKRASTAKRSSAAKKPTAKSSQPASTSRSAAKRAPAAKGSGASNTGSGPAAKRDSATKRASSAKRASPKRASSAKRGSSTRSSARRTASSRGASATPAGTAAQSATATATAGRDEALSRLTGMRDILMRSVMLTGDRIQEVVDDAVARGRMTRTDAEDIVQRLITLGRRQTEDLISDLEQLVGRGASTGGDQLLQRVDRARRAVGIGTFPILGYDDLSSAQVGDRLADLTPAQLRKVRDYETRNANRKSVLQRIERKLG